MKTELERVGSRMKMESNGGINKELRNRGESRGAGNSLFIPPLDSIFFNRLDFSTVRDLFEMLYCGICHSDVHTGKNFVKVYFHV